MTGRGEFDEELDSYLAERRKDSLLSSILKRQPTPKASAETSFQAPNKAPEETLPTSQVAEKSSGWTGFWNRLFGSQPEPLPTEESMLELTTNPDMTSDFKEVARITLEIMKRLPEDQLSELKESSEFSTFKDILRKHNIIK